MESPKLRTRRELLTRAHSIRRRPSSIVGLKLTTLAARGVARKLVVVTTRALPVPWHHVAVFVPQFSSAAVAYIARFAAEAAHAIFHEIPCSPLLAVGGANSVLDCVRTASSFA